MGQLLGTGFISTLSGTGDREGTPDEGPLEGTPLRGPRSIDTDDEGNAYLVLREGNAVFRLDLGAGRLQRIAGTGETGFTGDGGPAPPVSFCPVASHRAFFAEQSVTVLAPERVRRRAGRCVAGSRPDGVSRR